MTATAARLLAWHFLHVALKIYFHVLMKLPW